MEAVLEKIDPFAPPPPPPEHPKFDTTKPVEIVSKFTMADMPNWGPWLLWKMKQRWPRLSERTYVSWLQNYIMSNQAFLRKTKHTLLFALIENEPLDPQPIVREILLYVTDMEFRDESAELYKELATWATSVRAKGICGIGIYSDLLPIQVHAMLKKAGLKGKNNVEITIAL